jgi:hypothetical protein
MLAAEYLGHIVGGSGYVYAAWRLTYLALVSYGLSLYLRRAREKRHGNT